MTAFLNEKIIDIWRKFDNVKILITYHSKYLTDNLPTNALVEDKAKVEDPADVIKAIKKEETTKV